jgi:superfamily II DNA or RNA helicase
LYEQPLTRGLDAQLRELSDDLKRIEDLDAHEASLAFARLLHDRLVQAFGSLPTKDRVAHQIALANRVLEVIRESAPKSGADVDDEVMTPARRLLAVLEAVEPPAKPLLPDRPEIPLASSDLLVNGRHDVSIGPEVKRELASADRVDLLCSFLKWSGLRLVESELRDFLRRRPGGLRVLTTTYMSATQRRALDALVEMGALVRVSYDTSRTRLHAKAWLFHRESGFSTACIGSSNLSAAAMLDGVEWNVRLSQIDNGGILDKFSATFDQYWADADFKPYDAEEFDRAVLRQRRAATAPFLKFDIEPRPHQQEILEELAAERARGHHRNLVVAATGTGKTIVAALDYKRLRAELPRDRLLFVAHRKEILQQSLDTFRVVLRDGAFGELLVDGEHADRWEHVFASVQSLHEERLEQLRPEHFDVVIVDEFHHAAADTYSRLLARLSPRILLGLTATPERADGRSILGWFDGRIASELRLWKALDQGLLSPFQYFGIGGPDVSGVKWSGGRYVTSELSGVYTGDDVFALRILQQVHAKVADVSTMRALGFCVDIAHAEFMAAKFRQAGLPAAAVSANTKSTERDAQLAALRSGALRALFSVDLFNEGVDVPDVDTVLFLRPTESATVFLQQLGRGLRRRPDKECLTVLDFIGSAHRKFRFDARFRAIVGGTRRSVQREIERGFPSLPSGCFIQLDRQSQEAVLANIQDALGMGRRGLIEDLHALVRERGDVDLATFLQESGTELEDLYAGGWCWTKLRREAGLSKGAPSEQDLQIERAFSRMLHLDDPWRLGGLRELLAAPSAPSANPDDALQRILYTLLGYVRRPLGAMQRAWDHLWTRGELREELRAILTALDDQSRRLTYPLEGRLASIPLRVHGTYTLDETMAAFDERNRKGGVKRIQTGVYYLKPHQTDLFFVTLEKSERHYSPTTLYNDYPISDRRFHWESQSNCHEDTPTGRRYMSIGDRHQALLFVRRRRTDDRGETMPYTLLGPCHYRTHRGARPMQIEWDLERPMPAAFYQETKLAAG